MKPHKQSDHLIGYPVDKREGSGAIRVFLIGAALVAIACARFA